MKISTSLDYGVANGLTYAECASVMKKAGFQGIDLSMCKNQNDPKELITDRWTDDVLSQARAAKDAGLEIAQCHLPYYPGHLENPGSGTVKEFADFMVPMYEHALEAAAKIGVVTCVAHTLCYLDSRQKTIDANIEVFQKIEPIIRGSGMRLAIENGFARRHSQYVTAFIEQKEAMGEMIEGLHSPCVGACIDTGHANIFRYDICEMARFFGDRLFALHINSNAGHDEHAIPYSIAGWCERMDFEGFTRTLNEIGYTGWYNLEITGGRWPKEVAPFFYGYAAGVAGYLAGIQ